MRRNVAERGIDAALAIVERGNQEAPNIYAGLIRQCASSKSYREGKRVHEHLLKHGYGASDLLSNCLVQMYGKCGNLQDARKAFDSCATKSEYSWSAIIAAFARNGKRHEALELFRSSGMKRSIPVLMSALGACSSAEDLPEGRALHQAAIAAGFRAESDAILATAVFSMYAKCGSFEEARAIFDQTPVKDVVSYTTMISAYAQHGHYLQALNLFGEMESKRISPNCRTYACLLSACSGLRDLELGRSIHRRIIAENVQLDAVLENSILNMYARCGSLEESIGLFQGMSRKNTATWNSMISAYVQRRLFDDALELFHGMDSTPNSITFTSILSACCSPEYLDRGREIHRRLLASGISIHSDEILQNALVSMYGKCGSIDEAEKIFRGIRRKNVYSWTGMITAYSHQPGREREAIELFRAMELERSIEPDPITYSGVIVACGAAGDLEEGMRIHSLVESKGIQSSMIGTSLIDLYGKCGKIEEALKVFENLQEKDAVAYTTIIVVCVQNNHHSLALEKLFAMELEGFRPNDVTFSVILTACSYLREFEKGKQIEARIDPRVLEIDQVLQTGLLNLYSKCAGVKIAREIFDRLGERGMILWTTMIAACNQEGQFQEALELFNAMDCEPDSVTFMHAINACGSLRDLEQGKEVHRRLACSIPGELELNPVLQTSLAEMYVKCGDLQEAMKMFDGFHGKDVVSWTSMISVCHQERFNSEALKLYHRMSLEGMEPNAVTYSSVINSCAFMAWLKHGRHAHARACETGYISSTLVKNSLIHMYSQCGRLELAKQVFESVEPKTYPSWRILLAGFAQNGHPAEALKIFGSMHLEGFKLGSPVFSAALVACTALENFTLGQALYDLLKTRESQPDLVLQNIALNMFGKGGKLEHARLIFDGMPERNFVTWSTMVGAYAQNGCPLEALRLFKQMDVEANHLAFLTGVIACSELGDLREGMEIHLRIIKAGLECNEVLVSALVMMYTKCGQLQLAREFFDGTFSRDVAAWNSMANSYAQFGLADEVLELYKLECLHGVPPNGITFLSILVACSHMGMVEECKFKFGSMVSDHGVTPVSEHYSCMTDLLGRSGRLEEAEKLVSMIASVPERTSSPVAVSAWMSFLGACKTHNDSHRASRAAEMLYELDPGDTAPYVLLSQTYEAR